MNHHLAVSAATIAATLGLAGPAAAHDAIRILPNEHRIDFGRIPAGQVTSKRITIFNTSRWRAFYVHTIGMSNPDDAFSIPDGEDGMPRWQPCLGWVPPRAHCSYRLYFSPKHAGRFRGQHDLVSSEHYNGFTRVKLTGRAW